MTVAFSQAVKDQVVKSVIPPQWHCVGWVRAHAQVICKNNQRRKVSASAPVKCRLRMVGDKVEVDRNLAMPVTRTGADAYVAFFTRPGVEVGRLFIGIVVRDWQTVEVTVPR